jgi:hypothetical protein
MERARTVTRRTNPQPFFNLFRPVVRAPSEGTATPRDDTNESEVQMPTQSDRIDVSRYSEAKLEVCGFPRTWGRVWILTIWYEFANQSAEESESNGARAVDYINPLPMPSKEMIYNPKKKTEGSRHNTKRKTPRRTIRVSPSAHLAGR